MMADRYNRSTGSLVSIHHDQNILLTSLETKKITRQIIGFNDEIIDCAYLGPNDSIIALATNSSLIRIYDAKTLDARLVPGHTDVVLCLDVSSDGNWLISGSKDNTVRVWGKTSVQGDWKCLAIAEGHAESIGAVAISRKEMAGRGRFLFSASQDKTVKMWDLSMISTNPEEYPKSPIKLKSLTTMKIHEKDINSLDIAPNDGYLVSGSQDKSIKVFSVDFTEGKQKPGQDGTGYSGASGAIRLLGTCTGHRRGVWAVKFSPTDKVIASCGGDRVARLWSLDDFTCVKVSSNRSSQVSAPNGRNICRRSRVTRTLCFELTSCRKDNSL
jgi:U3 small nucleolar RNA-associated protein 13